MSSESNAKPNSRRWLRFNLRTFLIVTAIFSALIGSYANRAAQQRSAVRWIEKHDGIVTYRYESNPIADDIDYLSISPSNVYLIEPPVPYWLLDLLDINYFSDVVGVSLFDTEVADITQLAGLKSLEHLDLNGTQISEEEFRKLQRALPNCEIIRY